MSDGSVAGKPGFSVALSTEDTARARNIADRIVRETQPFGGAVQQQARCTQSDQAEGKQKKELGLQNLFHSGKFIRNKATVTHPATGRDTAALCPCLPSKKRDVP